MRSSVLIGLTLLVSVHSVSAQPKRRPLDAATVLRLSAGQAAPTGPEVLAKAWSPGPAVDLSIERYLRDPRTLNEFSVGVLAHFSLHPFDATGFVRDLRPSGDTPLTASGKAATMTKLAAVARVASPRRRVSPFLFAEVGLFGSDRGDVVYTGTFGTRTARMGSKFGAGLGLGLGADFEFGRSALGLEADWFMGSSNRDDAENSGRITCNSGGCGIPRERTQVVSLRASLRQILKR